jgi:hypothetical protein
MRTSTEVAEKILEQVSDGLNRQYYVVGTITFLFRTKVKNAWHTGTAIRSALRRADKRSPWMDKDDAERPLKSTSMLKEWRFHVMAEPGSEGKKFEYLVKPGRTDLTKNQLHGYEKYLENLCREVMSEYPGMKLGYISLETCRAIRQE